MWCFAMLLESLMQKMKKIYPKNSDLYKLFLHIRLETCGLYMSQQVWKGYSVRCIGIYVDFYCLTSLACLPTLFPFCLSFGCYHSLVAESFFSFTWYHYVLHISKNNAKSHCVLRFRFNQPVTAKFVSIRTDPNISWAR